MGEIPRDISKVCEHVINDIMKEPDCTFEVNQRTYRVLNTYGAEFITSLIDTELFGCYEGALRLNIDEDKNEVSLEVSSGRIHSILRDKGKLDTKTCSKFPVSIIDVGITWYKDSKRTTSGHASTIIVNNLTKTMYRIESNGQANWNDEVDDALKHYLAELKPDYKFIPADTICPIDGPQYISQDAFCANWSLLFMYIHLKCQTSTIQGVQNYLVSRGKAFLNQLIRKWTCFKGRYIISHRLDIVHQRMDNFAVFDWSGEEKGEKELEKLDKKFEEDKEHLRSVYDTPESKIRSEYFDEIDMNIRNNFPFKINTIDWMRKDLTKNDKKFLREYANQRRLLIRLYKHDRRNIKKKMLSESNLDTAQTRAYRLYEQHKYDEFNKELDTKFGYNSFVHDERYPHPKTYTLSDYEGTTDPASIDDMKKYVLDNWEFVTDDLTRKIKQWETELERIYIRLVDIREGKGDTSEKQKLQGQYNQTVQVINTLIESQKRWYDNVLPYKDSLSLEQKLKLESLSLSQI